LENICSKSAAEGKIKSVRCGHYWLEVWNKKKSEN